MLRWGEHLRPTNICGSGSIPAQCRICIWVEFVVGSNLVPRDLQFQFSSFPPYTKTNISKFQFNQDSKRASNQLMLTCRYTYLFIYLFYFSFIFQVDSTSFWWATKFPFSSPQRYLTLFPHSSLCIFLQKCWSLWLSPPLPVLITIYNNPLWGRVGMKFSGTI